MKKGPETGGWGAVERKVEGEAGNLLDPLPAE